MKFLALLACMVFMPLKAWCGIAPNTTVLWTLDNTLNDSSGNGYTLLQNGTLSFSTTPAPPKGVYSVTGFNSSTNGYSSAVRTAISGSTTYTFEAYIYITDLSAQRMIFSGGSSSSSSIFVSVLSTGAFHWVSDDSNVYDSSAGDITVNTWYYVAFVVNGTNLKVYKGLPGVVPSIVINTTATSPESPTAGNFYVGAYSLLTTFLPFVGYMDFIRISNVARTTLPTIDPPDGMLSPYMKQSQFPFVSPRWK